MRKVALLFVLILLAGCHQEPSIPKVDASKLKVGMTSDEVRKTAGEPFPGASRTDTGTGLRQETWIYPSGDDAIFLMVENGLVKSVNVKRVTMKDAAQKVRTSMTSQEVIAALGSPSGTTGDINNSAMMTYVNEEAALDDLTLHFEKGRVVKVEVNVNRALSR